MEWKWTVLLSVLLLVECVLCSNSGKALRPFGCLYPVGFFGIYDSYNTSSLYQKIVDAEMDTVA